ncbi:MAG: NAD(P)-dependent oxidoreductase [Polyangiaceae bacterium]
MTIHATDVDSPDDEHEPLGCFPVALKLTAKRCLLIGSARETAGRARSLLEAGADLRILSEAPDDELRALVFARRLSFEQRTWEERDVLDCWLVVMTDQNPEAAARLGCICDEQRIFFCAVDDPEPSSFSHVAIARAGALWAAIGTAGKAPALASRMRQELQRIFDESHLTDLVKRFAELRVNTSRSERRAVLLRAAARVSILGRIIEGTDDAP